MSILGLCGSAFWFVLLGAVGWGKLEISHGLRGFSERCCGQLT